MWDYFFILMVVAFGLGLAIT